MQIFNLHWMMQNISFLMSQGSPSGFADIEKPKGCKDQESIQLSTTPDPGYQWENDKLTVRHHRREPRGQPFPSKKPQST